MKSKQALLDGLGWNFDKGTSLENVVRAAAIGFEKKYNAKPEACFLHIGDFKKIPDKIDGIVVRERQGVLAQHVHMCGEA